MRGVAVGEVPVAATELPGVSGIIFVLPVVVERGAGAGVAGAVATAGVGGCICRNQMAAPTIPSTTTARMATRRVFMARHSGNL